MYDEAREASRGQFDNCVEKNLVHCKWLID